MNLELKGSCAHWCFPNCRTTGDRCTGLLSVPPRQCHTLQRSTRNPRFGKVKQAPYYRTSQSLIKLKSIIYLRARNGTQHFPNVFNNEYMYTTYLRDTTVSHAAMNAVNVIVLMRKPRPISAKCPFQVHTPLAEKENLAD